MRKNISGVGFLLPAVLWMIVFTVFPLIYCVWLSLSSYRLGSEPLFAGISNYVKILSDYRLHNALIVTLKLVAAVVSIEFIAGFGLALLLNQEIRGKHFIRGIFTLPLFATPVALGYLGITIFKTEYGLIDSIFKYVHLPQIEWLSKPSNAFWSIAILDIWQWIPFCFIIFLAGLQSLPDSVYEAASLDGASGAQLLYHITIPLLAPVMGVILLLRLVEAFKIFDIVFSLTAGGPGKTTEVLSLFVYRVALRNFNLGYGSALAIFILIVEALISIILIKNIRSLFS